MKISCHGVRRRSNAKCRRRRQTVLPSLLSFLHTLSLSFSSSLFAAMPSIPIVLVLPQSTYRFRTALNYRATLCVSAVFPVVRCLSVRHVGALYPHGWRNHHSCFSARWLHHCSFWPQRQYPIPRGTPSAGAQNTRGWKILRLSTEIAVYLGNGTR